MGAATVEGGPRWDLGAIRRDFPPLAVEVAPGVPLAYLDNAATSLKPWPVIRAVGRYDTEFPANVHRAVHTLGERATAAYEGARERLAAFLNAADAAEIIFTRGATESVNLVAQSWGRAFLKPGDRVLLTLLEHHSNLIPWQMLARERGLTLDFLGLTDDGELDLSDLDAKLAGPTRLVALTAMSNVLGTRTPVEQVVERAHEAGALVLVDAAQLIAHEPIDVQRLGADFLVASAHKMFGPTGVGLLHARRELLDAMPPFQGGGSMVLHVDLEGSDWNDLPWKFEAGTPPIAQAIGFGAAADYLAGLDRLAAAEHEEELFRLAWEALGAIEGVRLAGPAPGVNRGRGPIVAFELEGVHPHDLATLLDRRGVAIRAGQHCAAPLHRELGRPATARASLALYNTVEEVGCLAEAVDEARRIFRKKAMTARS
jgi:cysteine desulfurase/selenocysteine lyase